MATSNAGYQPMIITDKEYSLKKNPFFFLASVSFIVNYAGVVKSCAWPVILAGSLCTMAKGWEGKLSSEPSLSEKAHLH